VRPSFVNFAPNTRCTTRSTSLSRRGFGQRACMVAVFAVRAPVLLARPLFLCLGLLRGVCSSLDPGHCEGAGHGQGLANSIVELQLFLLLFTPVSRYPTRTAALPAQPAPCMPFASTPLAVFLAIRARRAPLSCPRLAK